MYVTSFAKRELVARSRMELSSRQALFSRGNAVRSFANQSETECSVARFDGYAVHTSSELQPGRAGCHGPTCRSARLEASSFASCAAACLAQPFCEAVTWVGRKHESPLLRGSCWGRTAGSPATFLAAVAAGQSTFLAVAAERSGNNPDAGRNAVFVAGVVRCGPCEPQREMDALCTRLHLCAPPLTLTLTLTLSPTLALTLTLTLTLALTLGPSPNPKPSPSP